MMSMGIGHSAVGEAGSVAEYVAWLSDAEIKRYTDGYRRICRVEGSPSPSSGGSAAAAGASSPSFVPQRSSSSVSTGSSSDLAAAGSNAQAITAASQGGAVNKKQFRNKVLGAFTMIPHSLSDRLFEVLDAEHSGELSLANGLSGLAWLKHGSYDEQVQLLFIIYDLDSADEISREVLDRFMDVIYGRKRARHATTVAFLDCVFDGRSTLQQYCC